MAAKFVAYPVIITPEKNNEYYQYLVFLPDFGAYCQANSVLEALRVAHKFISNVGSTATLPEMNVKLPLVKPGQLVTFVNAKLEKD